MGTDEKGRETTAGGACPAGTVSAEGRRVAKLPFLPRLLGNQFPNTRGRWYLFLLSASQ